MEEIKITGRQYKIKEKEIPDNLPETVERQQKDSSIVETDLGLFQLDDLGRVSTIYTGYKLYNFDFSRYEEVGEETVNLLKVSNRELYFSKGCPNNGLRVGEFYLLDLSVADSVLGIDTEADEILIEATDSFMINVSGTDKESLSFLGKEFSDYSIAGGDRYPPNDYEDRSQAYIVKRSDSNTLRQETILSSDTVNKLCIKGGIEHVERID